MTRESFRITIKKDKVIEKRNETFTLTIVELYLKNQGLNFTIGAYSQSTVVIVDTTSK